MLASHTWLSELTGLSLSPEEVARTLTSIGLEVESMTPFGEGLDHVVIAEVRGSRAHPERDKLQLVTVFDGESESEVVCGAPNVPAAGGRVVLAKLGAKLPGGLEIAERKLGGVVSRGMLCAETELGIGAADEGILVLSEAESAAPGAPVVTALALRDVVYEIGLTPNRPDCLGHVGIARDLCAALDKPFSLPTVAAPVRRGAASAGLFSQPESRLSLDTVWQAAAGSKVEGVGGDFHPVRVDLAAPDRCPRYGAALVHGVRIGPSPFAQRYRLHVLGQRAINNVVDATNLILLGFGHPIHAFDYDRLRDSRIEVRLASEGESITTLDDESRTLTADDLLICDGQGPVALAGVMGGQNSEIRDDTTRVLIECAYFEPRSVRRTSKRTGLHTDSSHRFERGVDPEAVPVVLAEAARMIADGAQGCVVTDALDVHPAPVERARVRLRLARVEALLGIQMESERAAHILGALGCEVTGSDGGFRVTCPSHRPDLTREVDLIEELARIVGYDAIPTEVPTVRPSGEGTAPEVRFVRRLREAAAAAGLWEAVNFAFVSPGDLETARQETGATVLANPMSEERSVLRTGLLPGLARNLLLAQHHQQVGFRQFEVARVFRPRAGELLPDEMYELGVLLWGRRQLWYQEEGTVDFFDLKGALEATFKPLSAAPLATVADEALAEQAPYLHPKRRAQLRLGDTVVGHLGELHPDLVDALGLLGRPVFARARVPDLLRVAQSEGLRQARDLPRFPASSRDVAVVVSEEVLAGEVASRLAQAGGTLVEDVRLFDIYRGKPISEGHKSLAFRVVYRNPTSTLTDKAVDKAHAKVTRAAEQVFGGSVRK